MNFKEWLEAVDVMNASTDKVYLQPSGRSYTYYFMVNNEDYSVDFDPSMMEIGGTYVPGSYAIYFHGPGGFGLTNTAGSSAARIYTQVLLAIKKLLEIKEVNGLEFSAAAEPMKVIYDRFFRNYLKSDFVKISDEDYIRKSYLKKVWPTLDKYEKEDLLKGTVNSGRKSRNDVSNIKRKKMVIRQETIEAKNMIGKIMFIRDAYSTLSFPALVCSYEPSNFWNKGRLSVIALENDMSMYRTTCYAGDIIKEAPTNEANKLLSVLSKIPNYMNAAGVAYTQAVQRYGFQGAA